MSSREEEVEKAWMDFLESPEAGPIINSSENSGVIMGKLLAHSVKQHIGQQTDVFTTYRKIFHKFCVRSANLTAEKAALQNILRTRMTGAGLGTGLGGSDGGTGETVDAIESTGEGGGNVHQVSNNGAFKIGNEFLLSLL
jgi:citrate lyase gamma subunit